MKRKIIVLIIVTLFLVTAIIPSISGNSTNEITNRSFDRKIKTIMKIANFPSLSLGIVKNDSLVWTKSYGYSQLYLRIKPTKDTIYLISSASKPITTTAFLQLYEQGKFDLDEDVNNYLPFSLRNPNFPDVNITFRMLLTHRSSLFDYCLFTVRGIFELIRYTKFQPPTDMGSWLEDSLTPDGELYNERFWMDFQPGTRAAYSNVGFLVLGYLFELISEQSIEDYCQEHLFTPLEMFNTSYHPDNLNQNNFARPYIRRGIYFPLYHFDTNGFAPMCGIRTTVEDLSHYLIAHMNNGTYKGNRILKNETIALMHNCTHPETEMDTFLAQMYHDYGLGWYETEQSGETMQGHGGICPGFNAMMLINKTKKTGVIIQSNHFNLFGFFELRYPLKLLSMFRITKMLMDLAEEL
jgi:CubicO group peptidase (beta-lactamase class C family)